MAAGPEALGYAPIQGARTPAVTPEAHPPFLPPLFSHLEGISVGDPAILRIRNLIDVTPGAEDRRAALMADLRAIPVLSMGNNLPNFIEATALAYTLVETRSFSRLGEVQACFVQDLDRKISALSKEQAGEAQLLNAVLEAGTSGDWRTNRSLPVELDNAFWGVVN